MPSSSFLDITTVASREALRARMAKTLRALGYTELRAAEVLSKSRDLTRAISRQAKGERFHGVVFPSCIDPSETCWAIFELDADRTAPDTDQRQSPLIRQPDVRIIAANDPELLSVLDLYRMRRP